MSLPDGIRYLRQAHRAISRDFEAAFADRDWNIAIRRAQECVEYAVKAAFLILHEVPPKDHAPGRLRELLQRPFPGIAFPADEDVNAFVLVQPWPADSSATPRRLRVLKVVRGKYTILAETEGFDLLDPFIVEIDGSTVKVLNGDRRIALTDTTGFVEGRWTQRPITSEERDLVQKYVRKLAKQRDAAFYFEQIFDYEAALQAKAQALTVLRLILACIGLRSAVVGGGFGT